MTDAEQTLWRALRGRRFAGHKFRRQHPFDQYILDFVCLERRLVIEVDGGQHAEQLSADAARTAYLERAGFQVLRFWNNEVLQETDAVLAQIWEVLEGSPSSSTPSSSCPSP